MKKIIIIIAVALVLNIIWFWNIKSDQFLFLHDEFLPLSIHEVIVSFFIRNPSNLGSQAIIDVIVGFLDRIFYLVFYSIGINLLTIQKIFYLFKLFFLIIMPYYAFRKLAKLYSTKADNLLIFVISLWYSLNTFTLIYWHANAFSLTALVCYSLAPLTLYYIHQSIFKRNSIQTKLKAVILIFLMSFAFYLFAVFIFLIFIYLILTMYLNRYRLSQVLINILILIILYLPFISIALTIPYDIFSNKVQGVNFTGNEAYGLLNGGILFQLLMWYSWAIYIDWQPRNIFTFDNYLRSPQSIIAPFILYGLILIALIRDKVNKHYNIFLFIFLFLLFFIKGAQEPFGKIYLFLIQNLFIFNVFRSPDSKFGFGIVLIISIMLILVSTRYKKKAFVSLILLVILIQGFPIFNGIAIRGENTTNSSDRIIYISKDYKEVIDFLNNNANTYGYIMPFPPDSFTFYKLDNQEMHLGQDLLSKLSINPFIYFSKGGSMNALAYNKLSAILESNDLIKLKEFPIKYFVVRYDIIQNQPDKNFTNKLVNIFKQVYKNNLFTVYEQSNPLPIIQSENINYKINNPISYTISFKNMKKDQTLNFYQSFNSNWKLYTPSKELPLHLEELTYLWKKPLFDASHKIVKGYANLWTISPQYIKSTLNSKDYKTNRDGSIDFSLVLYYKPQSLFYNGALVSISYFFLLLGIIIFDKIFKMIHKQ